MYNIARRTSRRLSYTVALIALSGVMVFQPQSARAFAPPSGPVILEYPMAIEGNLPVTITGNKDGNVWFTQLSSEVHALGQITPSGAITNFPLPNDAVPLGITSDAHSNLWFTDIANSAIGSMTTSGIIHEYPIFGPKSEKFGFPVGITMGPDGNIWFTLLVQGLIGRMTPSGVVTLFHIPTFNSLPIQITTGRDGNLWFSELAGNAIGKITPSGVVTEYPLPHDKSGPIGLTAGPDGNIWFAEAAASVIGSITPTGTITEVALTPGSGPTGITTGRDGKLWFTELAGSSIGNMTPDGLNLNEYVTPSFKSGPLAITAGPDGGLWFTEIGARQIGTVKTAPALVAVAGDYCASSTTTASLTSCVVQRCELLSKTTATLCKGPTSGPNKLARWTFADAEVRGPFNTGYGLPTAAFLQCQSVYADKNGVIHRDIATVDTLPDPNSTISGYGGVPGDLSNLTPTNMTGKMAFTASASTINPGPTSFPEGLTTNTGTAAGSVTVDNTLNGERGRVKSGNIKITINGDILTSHWDMVSNSWITDPTKSGGSISCTAGGNMNALYDAHNSRSPIGDHAIVSSPGPLQYWYLPSSAFNSL